MIKRFLWLVTLLFTVNSHSIVIDEKGFSIPKNSNEAAELLVHMALERNDASALWVLGSAAKNTGDYKQAIELFNKSAEQDYGDSQFELYLIYSEGLGTLKDEDKAVKWFLRAIKQNNIKAQHILGRTHEAHKNNQKAVEWYLKSARQGYDQSQFRLGVIYSTSSSPLQDHKKAVEWYLKAAEQGLAEAQYNLAASYLDGRGVDKDYIEAIKWFRQGANQEVFNAQYALGVIYIKNEGVLRDLSKAKHWIERARSNPNATASDLELAEILWNKIKF